MMCRRAISLEDPIGTRPNGLRVAFRRSFLRSIMNRTRRRLPLVLFALSLVVLFACGGQSAALLDDAGDTGACPESPCASDHVWNPAKCMCVLVDDAGPPVGSDATTR